VTWATQPVIWARARLLGPSRLEAVGCRHISYEESIYANVAAGPQDVARYVGELRAYFQALPVDRFPSIVALAEALTSGTDGDERFEFGLDVLVRGLASFAADPRG
jgi:hypothetical protein